MSDETLPSPASILPVPAWDSLCTKRKRGGRYADTYSPQNVALRARSLCNSWQEVADVLGHSKGYWHHIALGDRQMSRADENELRRRLHLAPKGITKIERMKTADLKRYIEERRTVG